MRAVLNVSLPQDLYSEIDDAVVCKEFDNKSQLVQTLISQWSASRHQQQRRQQTRRETIQQAQNTAKHITNLLALGLRNVKNDFVQLIQETIAFFIFLGRSTKFALITLGRDFRHTTINTLQFILHLIDKKPVTTSSTPSTDQVLYTRRSTPSPIQPKLL